MQEQSSQHIKIVLQKKYKISPQLSLLRYTNDMSAFINIFLIAFSLALDSLSVSIAGGMRSQKSKATHALKIAFFFGIFQAGMPILGWMLGELLLDTLTIAGPWIAFVLLGAIGLKMIYESIHEAHESKKDILDTKTLTALAIATSIDALVIGVTLPLLQIPFPLAILTIGLVTFVLCFLGFLFGKKLGTAFGKRVEIIGGLVLIGIGVKILLEGIL